MSTSKILDDAESNEYIEQENFDRNNSPATKLTKKKKKKTKSSILNKTIKRLKVEPFSAKKIKKNLSKKKTKQKIILIIMIH